MDNKRKWLAFIITTTLILWIVIQQPHITKPKNNTTDQVNEPSNEQTSKPKKNNSDSNITTDDLSQLELNGKPFKINKYNNQNVIISFFSSTCPYCTQQTELFEMYRDELDYEVFYVPYNEDFARGKEHILSLDYNVDSDRVLKDPDSIFARQLNLQATPTNLFATQDNHIVKGVVGLTSGETHNRTDKEHLEYLFNLLN